MEKYNRKLNHSINSGTKSMEAGLWTRTRLLTLPLGTRFSSAPLDGGEEGMQTWNGQRQGCHTSHSSRSRRLGPYSASIFGPLLGFDCFTHPPRCGPGSVWGAMDTGGKGKQLGPGLLSVCLVVQ